MKTKLLSLLLFFAMSVGFAQVNSVAIVGGSVTGGWGGSPDEHQMTSTDGVHWTLEGLEILAIPVGDVGVKFRANNAWDINWGSTSFPTGVATQGGANIIGVPNFYDVTFNSVTGEFHFEGPPVPVVKLVGAAVPAAEGIQFSTTDAVLYTASNVTLLTGDAQFNLVIEDVNVNYGDTTFPTGEAINEGVMIPVVAGTYSTITYDTSDGAYVFTAAPVYPVISLTGDGIGGWPNSDPDPNVLTTTDGETYRGTFTLTVGEIKFRQNNSWDPSWGGSSFPTGTGVLNSPNNIVVTTAGTYDVIFTRSTGAYAFSQASFAIVGDGAGGWPPFEGPDPNVMTTTDGANYTLPSITLTTGSIKFRANNDWAINFGGTEFPGGTGVSNSNDNIPSIAGTYGVTFNRLTGVYNFGEPFLATSNFNAAAFKAYPNPTRNNWNFDAAKQTIESIQIVDVLGKTVISVAPKATTASVDASALNNGVYFARIATATGSKTVKVVKN